MARGQGQQQEDPRPREVEVITDEELRELMDEDVEYIDLNSQRDKVLPTTWHML